MMARNIKPDITHALPLPVNERTNAVRAKCRKANTEKKNITETVTESRLCVCVCCFVSWDTSFSSINIIMPGHVCNAAAAAVHTG